MKTIQSFTVNHDVLKPGMYVSRVDGDVVTYDIRMKTPNGGDYVPTPAAHTIEHLFATYARNSGFSDGVIYVGPMGCRTGFYLLLRDRISHAEAIRLVQESFAFVAAYEGEIPGTERWQCGNYPWPPISARPLRVGRWISCGTRAARRGYNPLWG